MSASVSLSVRICMSVIKVILTIQIHKLSLFQYSKTPKQSDSLTQALACVCLSLWVSVYMGHLTIIHYDLTKSVIPQWSQTTTNNKLCRITRFVEWGQTCIWVSASVCSCSAAARAWTHQCVCVCVCVCVWVCVCLWVVRVFHIGTYWNLHTVLFRLLPLTVQSF